MSLDKIHRIAQVLRDGDWVWKPVRRTHIPKKRGGTRPLGIPSWSDKLVQQMIKFILELYYHLGDYDEAGKMFDSAIAAEFSPAHHYNGIFLVSQGRIEDGIKELEAARKAQTSAVDPALLGALGYAYAKAGDDPLTRKILTQLEVPSETNPYVCKTAIAIVHIGLNDKEKAFVCLNEAVVDRDEYLLWLKVDPFFEPLKSDPRFQVLCEKVFGEPHP